jgi:pentatricopeptide repeat protein
MGTSHKENGVLVAGIKPCIITYNTVMDACVRGRAMQRALSLAMELRLHHLKPDSTTFATMLVLFAYTAWHLTWCLTYR